MKKKPVISIIIPVYNAENYLRDCITSIDAQTNRNFEVVFVDDGSTDQSANIIMDKIKEEDRFHLIKQNNSGPSAARRTGVKHSIADWITFVDADDTLSSDFVDSLISCISDDIDVIVSPVEMFPQYKDVINNDEYRRATIYEFSKYNVHAPWGKLFRKSLFNESVFDLPNDFRNCEDNIMNIRLSFRTTKDVKMINKIIYFYRDNQQGLSKNNTHNIKFIERWYNYIYESIPEDMINRYEEDYFKALLFSYYYLTKNKIFLNGEEKDYLKYLLNFTKKYPLPYKGILYKRLLKGTRWYDRLVFVTINMILGR